MALRFSTARDRLTAMLFAAVVAVAPAPAFAQGPGTTPPKQQKKLPEVPSKLPKVGSDRTRGLDFLFGALKAAPDEASAKHVEARIWALWMQTPSDTAALLMMRSKAAMDAQQTDVALKLLDAVLSEERLCPFARGHRAGTGPRTAPFWRAGGARHDHAGHRRRKARA